MKKAQKNNKPILIIFGPTGVGKSDLALQIAQHVSAEIVNMDVGQFYTPLSIGTAKPDWQKSPVPHHLFDVINEPKQLTVVTYRNKLSEKINSIWKNEKIPIVVGGSGFYLKSLFFPPRTIRGNNPIVGQINDDDSWCLLKKIDPHRAAQIDKKDTYRISRALMIWRETGKSPSVYLPFFQPLGNSLIIFANRERNELYDRIDNRVLQMIDQGWIDEVRNLQGTAWESFIRLKKIIGYDNIFDYLQHETIQARQYMIKIIQQRTRNYAKRQHTFWRMLKNKLKQASSSDKEQEIFLDEVNLTFIPLHLYIKQLLEQLRIK
jgi:tRNA dimethylallyltransferase